MEGFRSWLIMLIKNPKKAPGQNRTDASSLEGYYSTTELQAHEGLLFPLIAGLPNVLLDLSFFSNKKSLKS